MVTRLKPPAGDDVDFVQKIVDERKNGANAEYFFDRAAWWKMRIVEYNQASGDPTKIAASSVSEEDKGKFINLYSGGQEEHCHVQKIKQLRDGRRHLLICPACGEDGTPRTLDHYLPKSKFPEYSTHLKNLVPMCDICQGIKDNNILSDIGEKQFFHSYFDEIPEGIVFINIAPPFDSPASFSVVVANAEDSLKNRLSINHVVGLHIDTRLTDYCVEKYTHLLKLAASNRAKSNIEVSILISSFLFNESMKSPNSWGAIFYGSVLKTPLLLEYLNHGILPDFFEV